MRERGIRYALVNFDELFRLIEQSRYYDPAVTPPDLALWVTSPDSHLKSIRAWRAPAAPPNSGIELFEIDLPAPTSPTQPSAKPTLQDHIR